jgi:hypothetical protein
MRKILIFLLIAVCSTSIYAQKKKSAARNKLKSLVVYEQKFDKVNAKATKDSETKFNVQGNISEEIEYDNNKVVKHLKYEYDDNDNKTKETELDASGKTTKVTEFKYDDDGHKIKETEQNAAGKTLKKIEYKYEGDLKTEKTTYDGNNNVKSRKSYQYQTY